MKCMAAGVHVRTCLACVSRFGACQAFIPFVPTCMRVTAFVYECVKTLRPEYERHDIYTHIHTISRNVDHVGMHVLLCYCRGLCRMGEPLYRRENVCMYVCIHSFIYVPNTSTPQSYSNRFHAYALSVSDSVTIHSLKSMCASI